VSLPRSTATPNVGAANALARVAELTFGASARLL
jgi:hypothetical protein